MIAEIPYMLVWGFFSALGWLTANWTVEKAFPEKPKTEIIQQEKVNENESQRVIISTEK
jgi:hypothetical protein